MIVGRLQILSQRLFVPILLWGLCAVNSWAATVAVLPFDDLTMGGNALNPAFTEEVRNVLRDEGVDLVPTKDIDAFLVGNQLRNTGYLDSVITSYSIHYTKLYDGESDPHCMQHIKNIRVILFVLMCALLSFGVPKVTSAADLSKLNVQSLGVITVDAEGAELRYPGSVYYIV